MSTLAQLFLESPRILLETAVCQRIEERAKKTNVVYDFIERRLAPPSIYSDVVIPLDAVRLQAERFVFKTTVPEKIETFVRTGELDPKMVFETARLPASPMWVEWRTQMGTVGRGLEAVDTARVGCMVDTNAFPGSSDPCLSVFVTDYQGLERRGSAPAAYPFLAVTSAPPPWPRDGVMLNSRWSLAYATEEGKVEQKPEMETTKDTFKDLIFSLFAITTPRVCEVRESVPSAKLQRARARARKHPLIEYKEMVLQIGVGNPRYRSSGGPGGPSTEGTGDGGHKRLHRVIGHFRTYTKEREAPHVAWVPEHWRGDAALGILCHERNVSK